MSSERFAARHGSRRLASALMSGTALAFVLASSALYAAPAAAQTATALPPVPVDTDKSCSCLLDGTTVSPQALDAQKTRTSDTAALLDGVPGVAIATGGGVSGLPVIHGMADDRNRVEVNGMPITSACPNHMNPATSYIDPSQVSKVQVMAGVTPVSAGGDSIGSTIAISSGTPVFAGPGETVHTEGSLSTSYRSIDRAISGSAAVTAATDIFSLGYTGSGVRARDYHDGNGDRIATSQYASTNHAATLAARKDGNLLIVQGGQQFIPYEGFPNQRMDLTGNHARFLNTSYQGDYSWGTVEARVYWQNVKHDMNFLSEKTTNPAMPGMPMSTDGTDLGYSVKTEIPLSARDTLRFGNELHAYRLNDWWPPTSTTPNGTTSPNTFLNINEGRRDQLGTYGEWEARWDTAWTTLLGLRNDTVWMNTGSVQGYSNNAIARYGIDAARFNALDHARTDVNFDVTALARYEPTATNTDELAYARKSRSPNLYERYAWSTGTMASSMVNWFGDGNEYVGNPDLKPEVANTISASAGWHDAERNRWDVRFTPYYTYVQDYIGVDQLSTGLNHGSPVAQLRFANHDAEIYGLDIAGHVRLWNDPDFGQGQIKGVAGWLRGQTINTGDSLYHMMPLNGTVTLEHSLGGWTNAAEVQMVASKSQADPLRYEPTTPGYALVNLRASYQWENVRFDLGIENLFNQQYYQPLGGVDFGDWKYGGFGGVLGALPGFGRSYDAGMTVKF